MTKLKIRMNEDINEVEFESGVREGDITTYAYASYNIYVTLFTTTYVSL